MTNLSWSDLWPIALGMPHYTLAELGHQLGDDDFVDWLRTRSPRVQLEVVEDAPEALKQHLYREHALCGATVMALNRCKLTKGGH